MTLSSGNWQCWWLSFLLTIQFWKCWWWLSKRHCLSQCCRLTLSWLWLSVLVVTFSADGDCQCWPFTAIEMTCRWCWGDLSLLVRSRGMMMSSCRCSFLLHRVKLCYILNEGSQIPADPTPSCFKSIYITCPCSPSFSLLSKSNFTQLFPVL